MEYIKTSKILKSEVSSVVKGGGKKPKLGKVSMYGTSPNPHLSMIWHLKSETDFFPAFKEKTLPAVNAA